MGVYIGNSEKLRVSLNDAIYHIKWFSDYPITNNIRLLSFDKLILKDSNGLFLTVKDGE